MTILNRGGTADAHGADRQKNETILVSLLFAMPFLAICIFTLRDSDDSDRSNTLVIHSDMTAISES